MSRLWCLLASLVAACVLGVTAAAAQELPGGRDQPEVQPIGIVPQVLDLKAIDPRFAGFSAAFSDGKYVYMVPESYQTAGASGTVVRVDLDNFTPAGVDALDLTQVDPALQGFAGGFTDGRYGYFVPFGYPGYPQYNYSGKVARVDLHNFGTGGVTVLDLTAVNRGLVGFFDGFTDGRYGYLVPLDDGSGYLSGLAARVDLWNFTAGGVTVLDLTAIDPALRAFGAGFASGPYAYFISRIDGGGVMTGKVARVDRANFTASGVTVLDLALVDPDLTGFIGAFVEARYAYLVPSGNGMKGFSGKAARIDLENFSPAGVTALDLALVDPTLKGFRGGFSDGRFAYYAPCLNAPNPSQPAVEAGKMARVDLRNWTASNVQVIDLAATDPDLVGFRAGLAASGYGYLVPGFRGKLARLPLFVPRYRLDLPLALRLP